MFSSRVSKPSFQVYKTLKILVCKTFGIGNAIMSIPMVKALATLGPVDVLVGRTPDDNGAFDVFKMLKNHFGVIEDIHVDLVKKDIVYDVAVLAIPYDGRWVNGVHFKSKAVIDGRPRPDPSTMGFSSWKKHEVLYQMENAEALGYKGEVPSMEFFYPPQPFNQKTVYLGLGYKKDAAGFWKQKHWGNENYAKLVSLISESSDPYYVVTTGDMSDIQMTIKPIQDAVGKEKLVLRHPTSLVACFDVVARAHVYVGNDTGMMHVAASLGNRVIGIFNFENLSTKNHPYCERWHTFENWKNPVSPEEVFTKLEEFLP